MAYQTRLFERRLRVSRAARLSASRRGMPPKANAYNWWFHARTVLSLPDLGERLRRAANAATISEAAELINRRSELGPIVELPARIIMGCMGDE